MIFGKESRKRKGSHLNYYLMTLLASRGNLSFNSEMINIVLFTYPVKYYMECQILIIFEF